MRGVDIDMMPDWNSLESVSRWHSFFEVAGIVSLAVLVAMEVGAYIFGHRKDHLTSAEADARLQAVKIAQAPRRLSDEQALKFSSFLKGKPALRIVVGSPLGDGEAKQYAQDFCGAFARGGWPVPPENVHSAFYAPEDPVGLVVGFSSPDAKPDPSDASKTLTPLPASAAVVGDALRFTGLEFEYRYTKELPTGTVELRVGHKPP